MALTSDADWAEIKKAGRSPDEAREEVTAQNNSFWDDPDREFEVREYQTKIAVWNALKLTKELSDVLTSLRQNENYRCYNTGDNPLDAAELGELWDSVDRLRERLSLDSERFKKKNKKDRDKIRLNNHVRRLLEIQQRWLNTKLPVQAQETATSVRFRKYVELCAGGDSGAALEAVTRIFARQRKQPAVTSRF